MIVSGYTLDLYCDYPDPSYRHMGSSEFPGRGVAQFASEKKSDAWVDARRAGWKFYKDGSVLCPSCVRNGNKLLVAVEIGRMK